MKREQALGHCFNCVRIVINYSRYPNGTRERKDSHWTSIRFRARNILAVGGKEHTMGMEAKQKQKNGPRCR